MTLIEETMSRAYLEAAEFTDKPDHSDEWEGPWAQQAIDHAEDACRTFLARCHAHHGLAECMEMHLSLIIELCRPSLKRRAGFFVSKP